MKRNIDIKIVQVQIEKPCIDEEMEPQATEVEMEDVELAENQVECEICYMTHPPEDMKKLQNCEHEFCKDCFKENFRSLIEDQNKHHDIKCLQYGCANKPTDEDIKTHIGEVCFAKYKKFQRNQVVAQNKHLIYCSKIDCEEILDTKIAVKNVISCKCGAKTCAKCKIEAHGKISCEKYAENKYGEWVNSSSNIHNCPSCGCQVEKNAGCPHMTCASCKYQWCWICGGKYQGKILCISRSELHGMCGNLSTFSTQWYLIILLPILMALAPVLAAIVYVLGFAGGTICCIGVSVFLSAGAFFKFFRSCQYQKVPILVLTSLLLAPCLLIWVALAVAVASAACIVLGALVLAGGIIAFVCGYLLVSYKMLSISVQWLFCKRVVRHKNNKAKTESLPAKDEQSANPMVFAKEDDIEMALSQHVSMKIQKEKDNVLQTIQDGKEVVEMAGSL